MVPRVATDEPVFIKALEDRPEAWKPILEAAAGGNVTLLYSSRDSEHNNDVALKAYLEEELNR